MATHELLDATGVRIDKGSLMEPQVFSPVRHRYRLAGRELYPDTTAILDVGGYPSRRSLATRGLRQEVTYVTANVGPAWYGEMPDHVYDGERLPFETSGFDSVICVDTLEHMPREARAHFLHELVRVAARRTVVVTPIAGIETQSEEALLLEVSKAQGVRLMPSLVEHERFGLPSRADLEALCQALSGSMRPATPRREYWSMQMAMLWNTVAMRGEAETLNREVQAFQEQWLEAQPDPADWDAAYRGVLVFDK